MAGVALRGGEGEAVLQPLGTMDSVGTALVVKVMGGEALTEAEPVLRRVRVNAPVEDTQLEGVREELAEPLPPAREAVGATVPVTEPQAEGVGQGVVEGEVEGRGEPVPEGEAAAEPELGDTEGALVGEGAALLEVVGEIDTEAVCEARTGMLTMHVCTPAARKVFAEGVLHAASPAAAE